MIRAGQTPPDFIQKPENFLKSHLFFKDLKILSSGFVSNSLDRFMVKRAICDDRYIWACPVVMSVESPPKPASIVQAISWRSQVGSHKEKDDLPVLKSVCKS